MQNLLHSHYTARLTGTHQLTHAASIQTQISFVVAPKLLSRGRQMDKRNLLISINTKSFEITRKLRFIKIESDSRLDSINH